MQHATLLVSPTCALRSPRRSCALRRVAFALGQQRCGLHTNAKSRAPQRHSTVSPAAVHRSLQCYSLHCFSGALGGRATGMCWRTDGSVPQVPALGAYMMSNASAEELPQYSFDLWVMDKGARARVRV